VVVVAVLTEMVNAVDLAVADGGVLVVVDMVMAFVGKVTTAAKVEINRAAVEVELVL
jgi:hypothetical protein